MEHLKVAGAVVVNGMLAMVQSVANAPLLESALIVSQILVALATTAYIWLKVWKLWRDRKKN